jgi:nitroreductase
MRANLINKRWSPRSFSNKPVDIEMAEALFDAARWAPSSMNEQPWKYYYCLRDDDDAFSIFMSCLAEGNRIWAKDAGMVILSVARKNFRRNNRPNRHAMHDTGAANTLLALQAASMGLQAHQMGGYDLERTMDAFDLDPDLYEPASFIAIGFPGNPELLPEDLRKRELEPRTRREIDEFVTRFECFPANQL